MWPTVGNSVWIFARFVSMHDVPRYSVSLDPQTLGNTFLPERIARIFFDFSERDVVRVRRSGGSTISEGEESSSAGGAGTTPPKERRSLAAVLEFAVPKRDLQQLCQAPEGVELVAEVEGEGEMQARIVAAEFLQPDNTEFYRRDPDSYSNVMLHSGDGGPLRGLEQEGGGDLRKCVKQSSAGEDGGAGKSSCSGDGTDAASIPRLLAGYGPSTEDMGRETIATLRRPRVRRRRAVQSARVEKPFPREQFSASLYPALFGSARKKPSSPKAPAEPPEPARRKMFRVEPASRPATARQGATRSVKGPRPVKGPRKIFPRSRQLTYTGPAYTSFAGKKCDGTPLWDLGDETTQSPYMPMGMTVPEKLDDCRVKCYEFSLSYDPMIDMGCPGINMLCRVGSRARTRKRCMHFVLIWGGGLGYVKTSGAGRCS